jgi:recombinational DNA repair ATPase RecF
MADMFITKIQIDKVRHLENFTIELSDTERKHLILTGKNGSGKTSVLEAIRGKLSSFPGHTDNVDVGITLKELSSATIIQDDSKNKFFKFPKENIFLYVPAERKLNVSQQNTVKKITPTSSKDILQ